jgi:hypothetical protein
VCVYIYIHTYLTPYRLYVNYRCYQIITLRVQHFSTNPERFEMLTGSISLGPVSPPPEYKTVEGRGTAGVGSVVIILTTLRPGRSALRILTEARDVSLTQNVHTGCVVHPASSQQAQRVISTEIKLPGCKFGQPPPYSSELRLSADVFLLPLRAFTAWAGRTSR